MRSADPTQSGMGTKMLRNVAFWIMLVLIAAIFVGPLIWMASTSLKTYGEATSIPPTILPQSFNTEAYGELLRLDSQYPVLRWVINSLIAAVLHMILVLVVASMAAYAFARLEFRGRGVLFVLIISTLFVPAFVFFMPNYLIIDRLGWLNTIWALVVPGAAGAFGVFLLRQFFSAIPRDFDEAAALDGANQWQVFARIIVPNAKPALATLAVLSFLANWNDYIWPVFVLFSPDRLTLPAGLKLLQGAYVTDYPVIMAGAFVASVPVLILFIFTQRYIIEGVANSGVKG